MRRLVLALGAFISLLALAACQPQADDTGVGTVLNRTGSISEVKYDSTTNEPYKDVVLHGKAVCEVSENFELSGDIVQGDIRSHFEGGYACRAGETVEWSSNLGSSGAFPPDAALQPGSATVEMLASGDLSSRDSDFVRITRRVELFQS